MGVILYLRKKINKSQFGKNIILIAGGTAVAQGLGIIFSPIITRIYPPEQYGILTAYSAVLALLAQTASFDYEKAIPIPKNEKKAANLLKLSLFLLLTVVLLSFVILTFFGNPILDFFNSNNLSSYIYFIPLGVLFVGFYNIVLQWAFRDRSYKIIARTKINQSITSNFTKILFGILHFGPIGLILGTIIGQSAGVISLTIPILKKKKMFEDNDFEDIKNVLVRYKKFPLYSAPSNYVYTAGTNLPVILLASLFGTYVTGLYGLANSIIRLPVSLIGNSISQVFYAEAARIGKSNPVKIRDLSIKLIKNNLLMGIIPFGCIFIFGPWFFSFVFGPEWYEAGVYARILSPMVYFHFMVTPVGRILEIFESQQKGLILNIVRLCMIFLVFLLANAMKLNSYQTLSLYSLSNTITYLSLLIVVLRTINQKTKKRS